jgi:hypothetical protein
LRNYRENKPLYPILVEMVNMGRHEVLDTWISARATCLKHGVDFWVKQEKLTKLQSDLIKNECKECMFNKNGECGIPQLFSKLLN